MGFRTAVEHNPLVAFGLLFAAVWTGVVGAQIVSQMRGVTPGSWVGQHGFGGLMGLIVMGAFLALVLVAFAELGEPDPAPGEWPPEE
ncbi:hypothetical protein CHINAEXTREME_00160 [Halobiforma lacisalsi AJ5]|uniref:Uncharacterized protein n=1 Tax=Natronobacterium lacisalsi AJ5 TaxID=358396 RepID=M0LTA8_NATLA|nr:hypothetical protein [Halobiforma lacisalsi]APW96268.1 hypothetical protein CHINAEXTREME_00160 [Halobiforma lacisalsi AJ5]EMA36388.1 hypothetical protein C445_03118 [Halobiforma lacisalsi AJ5]